MRVLLLALLAVSGLAFASPVPTLPRGDRRFLLGWTASQLDSALATRGVEVLSRSTESITCSSPDSGVEFEQYLLATPPHGEGLLWKVNVGYRVPYTRATFEAVRGELIETLGPPAEVREPDFESGQVEERVSWADVRTAVQLGARWQAPQDPRIDRMVETWTDRRLQKLAEAKVRKSRKK